MNKRKLNPSPFPLPAGERTREARVKEALKRKFLYNKLSVFFIIFLFCLLPCPLSAENYELSDAQPVSSEFTEVQSGDYTLEVSGQAPVFFLPSTAADGNVIVGSGGSIPPPPPGAGNDNAGAGRDTEKITPQTTEAGQPAAGEEPPREEKINPEEPPPEEKIVERPEPEKIGHKEFRPSKELQPPEETAAGEETTKGTFELSPSSSGQTTLKFRKTKRKTTVSEVEGTVDIVDFDKIHLLGIDLLKSKCVFAVLTEIITPFKIVKIKARGKFYTAYIPFEDISTQLSKLENWKFIHVMAIHNLRTNYNTEYDIILLSAAITEGDIYSGGLITFLSKIAKSHLMYEAYTLNKLINKEKTAVSGKIKIQNIKKYAPKKFQKLFNEEIRSAPKSIQPVKEYSVLLILFAGLIFISVVITILKYKRK